jgi:hypothetical protein
VTAVLAPGLIVRRAPVARRSARDRLRSFAGAHGEQGALFAVFYAAYVTVAAVLVFHYGSVANDAVSRVDDGSEVLYSYQPHLAAVGFVWNPLPSLLEIPLLLLKGVWPALLTHGFAGNLVSAAFMAGAVVGVRGILADRGAGRGLRLVLPLMLALHPMSIVYGANGMSEAFFVFFMVWAARALLRYVERGSSRDLLVAGTNLGFGYLARYEAAAAAVGATLFVAVVVWFRTDGARHERIRRVLVDLTLLAAPFALAFIGWSALSYVIVGHLFEQFSSAYGNDGFIVADHGSIVAVTGQGTAAAIPYALRQLLSLEPFALVAVAVAVVVAFRRRSWSPLVPLAVFGPVVVFALGAFLAGETFGWLRFYIMEIPLCVVTIAVVIPPRVEIPEALDDAVAAGFRRAGVLMAAFAVLLPALYTGGAVFADGTLAREEHAQIYDVVVNGSRTFRQSFDHDATVAAYLDTLHAAPGTILTEAVDSTGVRSIAKRQDVFLETTDESYQKVLSDPVRFGIRYLLVAKPGSYYDSLLSAYPNIWQNGAGFGPMIASFPQSTEQFRVYRVTAKVTPGHEPLG